MSGITDQLHHNEHFPAPVPPFKMIVDCRGCKSSSLWVRVRVWLWLCKKGHNKTKGQAIIIFIAL